MKRARFLFERQTSLKGIHMEIIENLIVNDEEINISLLL